MCALRIFRRCKGGWKSSEEPEAESRCRMCKVRFPVGVRFRAVRTPGRGCFSQLADLAIGILKSGGSKVKEGFLKKGGV
jgi:hypothetical protein